MLQLYNKSKQHVGLLSQASDICIESDLKSGDKSLSFFIPKNFSENIENEGYIRTKKDEFVIKEINSTTNGFNVYCSLNLEDLEGKSWDRFESVEATISQCLSLALAATGWGVNICEIKKKRTIRITGKSTLDIINQCRKTYHCEIQFCTLTKEINIYEELGGDKGDFLMDSINCKKIDMQSSTNKFFTKIDAYGGNITEGEGDNKTTTQIHCTVENFSYSTKVKTLYWKDERYKILENLREDAALKLAEICKPVISYSVDVINLGDISLGDTIYLISKENGIREKQRVTKLVEYPLEPSKNTCEIANSIYTFEDIQQEQEETTSTVANITSDNGTISENAFTYTLNSVLLNQIDVKSLQALDARIGNLESSTIKTNELKAAKAEIQTAVIEELKAGDVYATNGDFKNLSSVVGRINLLISGSVTAGSTQTIVLNAQNTTIANGLIRNAMIETISADKINAGTLNTSNVVISSSSGGVQITDNTMQFKDKNGKVRIQIGEDEKKNFTFIVRAEDGTSTLIDGTGVKEKAITDGLIKTKMINDKAVTGKKIDWDDFFETINQDGTHTLNSSVIKLNSNNQTLDVAFNQMTTQIKNTGEGRNLCRKAWHINQDTNGRATLEITKDDWFDYVLKFNKLNSSGGWGILTNNKKIAFEYGKKYTLSFKAHTKDLTNIQVRICSESSTDIVLYPTVITLKNDNKYYDYNLTFEAKATTSQYLQFISDNGTVYLTNIKLEKGDKATTFCDAPEDLSDWIKTNSTAINVQQGKISSLVAQTEQVIKTSNKNKKDVVELKNEYSNIEQDMKKITATVRDHTSSFDEVYKRVSDNYSQIQQLKDKITLTVADIKVGGINCITNGGFTNGLNGYNNNGGAGSTLSIINESASPTGKALKAVCPKFGGGVFRYVSSNSSETTISFYAKGQSGMKLYFGYENKKTTVVTLTSNYYRYTLTVPYQSGTLIIYAQTPGTFCLHSLQIESGNKATDWSYNPKELMSYTDSKISEIKIEEDKITSRVQTTENILNKDGTGLVAKVSKVEQKITPSQLCVSVSEGITGNSQLANTNVKINKYGLTINNGAFYIYNKSNINVFRVNTSGDAQLRGDIYNYDSKGTLRVAVTNSKLMCYTDGGSYLGGIGSNNYYSNKNIKGLVIDLDMAGKYVGFGVKNSSTSNYNMVFSYHRDGSFQQGGFLHLGAPVDAHWKRICNVKIENANFQNITVVNGYATYTGTISYVTSIKSNNGVTSWVTRTLTIQNGLIVGV